MGCEVKKCDLLLVARRHFNRCGQILRHWIFDLHLTASDPIQQQQHGKCLRDRANLENSVAIDLLPGAVLELAGSENATAAFIDQSNDHVGIGEVLTEQRLDGFGLGIGKAVLCRGQELGWKEFQTANESYSEASLAYWNSDAGLSRQRLQREYRAMFGPEGAFRIDDVPPGDYTIKINLFRSPKLSEGNPPNFALFFDAVSSLETEATIPASSNPSDDTPVSLGTLNLWSTPPRRPAN